MKLQVVKVTPEIAARWLKNNGKNRSLSIAHVKRLAASMAAGRWSLNGQTISFDDQGRLLDGQHRLSAVVMSGVTVDMAIATDVIDERAFQTYDSIMLRRGAHQIAQMMGRVQNVTKVTAAARVLLARERANSYKDFLSFFTNATRPELEPLPEDVAARAVDFSEEYGVIKEKLGPFFKIAKIKSAFIAHLAILNAIDPVSTDSFILKLRTGIFNDEKDPVFLLRERMIHGNGTAVIAKSDRQNILGTLHLTTKAWNAHVQGKRLPFLRFSPAQNERVPVPVGSPKK